jgi:hypothetical protein
VVLSSDGQDALVYHPSSSDWLAGGGAAYWLTRDSAGRWRIRKSIEFWIS